jgi:2-hydroxycyclohexanecarboxyl-CoA dehydrogenase
MADLGLKDKVAIVTGGGSNIGRSIVLSFIKEGTNVTIADISDAAGKKVEGEANALGGGKALFVKTDVTDFDSVQAMVKKTADEFGKIDILDNNVGWTFDRLFMEKPLEEMEKEVKINYWSMIHCCKAVLPLMIEQKSGKVVTTTSDAGRMGEFRESVYGGCKAGVIALSKSLARENGRYGIAFNCVAPGATVPEKAEDVSELSMFSETGFAKALVGDEETQKKWAKGYPLRRLGRPQDIANAVLFFASDLSNYITGQVLSVDGGYAMVD